MATVFWPPASDDDLPFAALRDCVQTNGTPPSALAPAPLISTKLWEKTRGCVESGASASNLRLLAAADAGADADLGALDSFVARLSGV